MKTLPKTLFTVLMLALGGAASAAEPGMQWDLFHSGDGEPVIYRSYDGTRLTPAPGMGFDSFRSGDGQTVEDYSQAYRGTSTGAEIPGGWDVFRVGDGEPLP